MTNFPKRTMWDKHMAQLGLMVGSWEEVQLRKLEKQKQKEAEREAKLAPKRERDARLLTMRLDEQLTLGQIAKREGVSGERVRQLLRNIERREGIKIDTPIFTNPPIETSCTTCSAKILKSASQVKEGRKYYCEIHRGGRKYDYPVNCTTPLLRMRFRARWRYHNDPLFRERTNNHSKNWAKKQREIGNQHFIEKQIQAAKRWNEKLKADPVRYAAHNKKMKERWQAKYRSDPVFRENMKERWRKWGKLHPKKPK